ncbi:uncharacterized protein Z520_00129 [Fonsecaea multimorphosa CBS 102226]|uniref:Uncharacterized protein n=1 Tax=Fonsecaea multimorphosa CBS 102226 TaxID=1442371 RepID=A0A0D2KBM8_9EURO|nr:uncharacterized protein Z520_00129 [Fonsecaea multimorphosa CBS 102226]KIY03438.1 hypothetical protein Z520_00129 [Fonsecaea multimorphosa CBS 102226]OAL32844.1 hypothetical protein AYO22_00170 [Fonsecaea multimorphosa]
MVPSSLPLSFVLLIVFMHLRLCLADLNPRQSCGSGYDLCSPGGASTRDVPEIGPGLARLYLNLIQTVDPQPAPVHVMPSDSEIAPAHRARQTPGSLCCAETTQCLLVLSYNVPVCWDKFTTNYYLPDGSYGSITSGNYTTPNGDWANLITGNYRLANGQTGNIYQGDTLEEPNTSTLLMPTPWTSKGVGSAIPASEVGAQPTSNFSSMAPLPTLTTGSAGSASSDLATMTILSGSNVILGSTPAASIPTTPPPPSITPPPPSITPPITNIALGRCLRGVYHLWAMIMTFVTVTHLVTH